MFLNPKVLDERLKDYMHKYGINQLDPEVHFMINDAMKHKFTEIIKELIKIHRTQNQCSYLQNKNSTTLEMTEIKAMNTILKDKHGGSVPQRIMMMQ